VDCISQKRPGRTVETPAETSPSSCFEQRRQPHVLALPGLLAGFSATLFFVLEELPPGIRLLHLGQVPRANLLIPTGQPQLLLDLPVVIRTHTAQGCFCGTAGRGGSTPGVVGKVNESANLCSLQYGVESVMVRSRCDSPTGPAGSIFGGCGWPRVGLGTATSAVGMFNA